MERRNTTHQFLSTAKRFVFSLFCGILAQLSTQANTFFWPMAGTSGRFCEGTPWGSSHATFYFLCVLHVGSGKWWQDVSLQMVQVQQALHVSFNQLIVKLRCLPAHIVDHLEWAFLFSMQKSNEFVKITTWLQQRQLCSFFATPLWTFQTHMSSNKHSAYFLSIPYHWF